MQLQRKYMKALNEYVKVSMLQDCRCSIELMLTDFLWWCLCSSVFQWGGETEITKWTWHQSRYGEKVTHLGNFYLIWFKLFQLSVIFFCLYFTVSNINSMLLISSLKNIYFFINMQVNKRSPLTKRLPGEPKMPSRWASHHTTFVLLLNPGLFWTRLIIKNKYKMNL